VNVAALPPPHHVQARLAFGWDGPDQGRELGFVVSVEGDVVTVRFPLRAGVRRYQVDSRQRLRGALRRKDQLRLGGRPLVIVNDRYHALQLPHGPPGEASRLAAEYGLLVPLDGVAAGSGLAGGMVFNVRAIDRAGERSTHRPANRAPPW
jgi:hypothetical protein